MEQSSSKKIAKGSRLVQLARLPFAGEGCEFSNLLQIALERSELLELGNTLLLRLGLPGIARSPRLEVEPLKQWRATASFAFEGPVPAYQAHELWLLPKLNLPSVGKDAVDYDGGHKRDRRSVCLGVCACRLRLRMSCTMLGGIDTTDC